MTTTIDITRKRGDTRRIVFQIMMDGAPLDISAWTSFKLTIDPNKSPADDSSNIGQLTGILAGGGTTGLVYFVPTGTEPAGSYYYDAQALDENTEKTTFADGKYKINQDITKV